MNQELNKIAQMINSSNSDLKNLGMALLHNYTFNNIIPQSRFKKYLANLSLIGKEKKLFISRNNKKALERWINKK